MEHVKKTMPLAVYLALAVPMFYFIEEGIIIGGFEVMYMYLFGIGIIAVAIIAFLISPNVKKGILSVKYAAVMSVPYLWSILYSLLVWVFSLAEFRVMTRGLFYVMYQIIAVAAAAATVYLFGNKGIYYQFLALLGAKAIDIFNIVRDFGVGEFALEYLRTVTSFTADTGEIMRFFEPMELGFTMAFFLLFFLLDFKKNKKRILWLPVAIFVFFLGLKRITIAAMGAGVLLGWIGIRFLRKNTKKKVMVIITVIGIAALVYIFAVRMGLFDWLEARGLDSMGRGDIYAIVYDWYEMGPGYFGKGAGYISGSISSGELELIRPEGYAMGEIHNDLLRQYIELGFIGYLVWIFLFLNYRVSYFFHGQKTEDDRRHGILAAAVFITLFFTFMTDNTLYYYYTTIFSTIAIMSFRYEEYSDQIRLPGDEGY